MEHKEIIMPALGMAQDVGVLLRWLKEEGETIQAGEALMEVATDKVDVQVEAPASGVLAGVSAQAGDEIPVGQVIGFIVASGAASSPTGPERTASPVAARMAAEHGIDLAQVPTTGERIVKENVVAHLKVQRAGAAAPSTAARVLASPKARRLARERGIDLAAVAGSGPQGAVLAADIADPPTALSSEPPQTTEVPVSRIWQVMAQRLTESWTTIPHFYLLREVDASRLKGWRNALAHVTTKITYTDLLIKLVALSLRAQPRLNASFANGTIRANPDIHIGFAMAVEDGLLVPIVHNADQRRVESIAECRIDRIKRAHRGELQPADFAGGTFTISNLGMYGVDAFNAIVNPPQAAILAVGRIADRVVAVEGQPAVLPMLTLTLSCDHRVVDGVQAAQFLDHLAGLIEEPLRAV